MSSNDIVTHARADSRDASLDHPSHGTTTDDRTVEKMTGKDGLVSFRGPSQGGDVVIDEADVSETLAADSIILGMTQRSRLVTQGGDGVREPAQRPWPPRSNAVSPILSLRRPRPSH